MRIKSHLFSGFYHKTVEQFVTIEDTENIIGNIDFDFLGPSSPSERFDTGIDNTQHIQFGNKIRNPSL